MADQTYTPPSQPAGRDIDSFSDDVLVERLYDMAAQLISGKVRVDQEELARVDEVVYRRLEQAYSKDPHESASPPRLDS